MPAYAPAVRNGTPPAVSLTDESGREWSIAADRFLIDDTTIRFFRDSGSLVLTGEAEATDVLLSTLRAADGISEVDGNV